jgi:hypothetical protein
VQPLLAHGSGSGADSGSTGSSRVGEALLRVDAANCDHEASDDSLGPCTTPTMAPPLR